MPLTNPRRYRTAKLIQEKAVELAIRDGLTNTTTEAIAHEAGISTRSFFNYYPFKEAAIIGPVRDYPSEATVAFISANGSLLADLLTLVSAHLSQFEHERQLTRNVLQLTETDTKLASLRGNSMLERRTRLRDLMKQRMPNVDAAFIDILSAAILAATNRATVEWADGTAENLADAALDNIAKIAPAVALLSPADL